MTGYNEVDELENNLIIWIAVVIAAYIILKLLGSLARKGSDYEKELQKVLTSEEHKVKGRHE